MGDFASWGSMALNIGGSLLNGSAESRAAKASARLAIEQGAQAMDNARLQARNIRRAADRARGAARAAGGASGVDVNVGTSVDITDEIIADSERDAAMAILTGQREQRSARNQASIYRSQASNAQTSGFIGAASSLISGGNKLGWWGKNNGDATK